MNVTNKINKRLVKDKIRMFFEIENDTDRPIEGELLIEVNFGWFKKTNIKSVVGKIYPKQRRFIYYDVERRNFKPLKAFTWIFNSKFGSNIGEHVVTTKFENIYEG